MKKLSITEVRNQRRRNRSKRANTAHPERLRLVVYRSNKHIRAQVINDHDGATLASASSVDKTLDKVVSKAKTKTDIGTLIGTAIAERALKNKVKKVVFDRNGYPYHGRIKAFADGVRDGGLKI